MLTNVLVGIAEEAVDVRRKLWKESDDVTDVLPFAEDNEGDWRWFFGPESTP